MWDQQSLRSACAYAQSYQSLCWSLEYSMSVKLLTEHRLEFVSLKGGCTVSSESATLCRGSIYDILASSRCVRYAGYIHISKKMKNSDKYHKSSFSCMQCAVSCSSSLKFFFFISCKPMKRRHS